MAKKKSANGVNKSEIIREYKRQNPSAKPKEIVEAMAAAGVTVTAQMVSTVLSNAKKKGGKVSKRGRKAKEATMAAPASNGFAPVGLSSAFPIFKAAGELLKVAGDRSVAREALDMVAALMASGSDSPDGVQVGNGRK